MLNKCANQECKEEFRYFGEGKLFLRDPHAVFGMGTGEILDQCYWLCPSCAGNFKVDFVDDGVVVVPLKAA